MRHPKAHVIKKYLSKRNLMVLVLVFNTCWLFTCGLSHFSRVRLSVTPMDGFSVWNAQRQTQAASVTGGMMEVEKWSGAHLAGP